MRRQRISPTRKRVLYRKTRQALDIVKAIQRDVPEFSPLGQEVREAEQALCVLFYRFSGIAEVPPPPQPGGIEG